MATALVLAASSFLAACGPDEAAPTSGAGSASADADATGATSTAAGTATPSASVTTTGGASTDAAAGDTPPPCHRLPGSPMLDGSGPRFTTPRLEHGVEGTWALVTGDQLVRAWQVSPPDAVVRIAGGGVCAEGPGVEVLRSSSALTESVRWVDRGGVRSLAVRPTWVMRTWSGASDALVREIGDRAPEITSPGMRDQLRCHLAFAPRKAVWHLEPSRPDVGYVETVAARCNPGSEVDPDGF